MLSVAITIITILILFIYQLQIFSYALRILANPQKNKVLIAILAIINTSIVVIYFNIQVPLYLFYLLICIVLGIEFRIVSGASFLQSFCGANIFSIHIATVHIPIVVLCSYILKRPPIDITVLNDATRAITCLILCILIVALWLVNKVLGVESIQQVTSAPKYSILLLVATFTYVFFNSLITAFLVVNEQHDIQLLLAISMAMFTLLSFYFVFIYSIHIVDISFYKRQSDFALREQEKMAQIKDELSKKLIRDDLTGVYNRKYIMNLLQQLIDDTNSLFSVLFVDINALKYINDTLGHDVGDQLILKITKAITDSVRAEDFISRIGGDEFLVVLQDSAFRDTEQVINRIKSSIAAQNEKEDYLISASIGFITINDEMRTEGVASILERADEIMRQNKAAFYQEQQETKEGSL